MLEGDLVIEDQVFLLGDFIRYGPGSAHRAHTQGGVGSIFAPSWMITFSSHSLPSAPKLGSRPAIWGGREIMSPCKPVVELFDRDPPSC